jgi:hypothetical protein
MEENAGMNRIAIMKASTKAKLLSGTYILQQTQSKFKKRQISAICLMCNSDIEDRKISAQRQMEDHKSPEFPLHIKTSCVKRRLLLTPVAHIIPFQSLHI